MTVMHVVDAATPPQSVPAGFGGVLGYIGGAKASRVWTPAEWQRFGHLAQFPAYVPTVGADAATQGIDACKLARALGWAPDMPGNTRRAIIIDVETAVDAAWYATMADTINAGGFTAVCYGSASTVLQNAADDVWIAEWVDSWLAPPIPKGQTLRGLQYDGNVSFGGTQVDLSVVGPWLMARAGVGPRHG